jgi:hypothetical protein
MVVTAVQVIFLTQLKMEIKAIGKVQRTLTNCNDTALRYEVSHLPESVILMVKDLLKASIERIYSEKELSPEVFSRVSS